MYQIMEATEEHIDVIHKLAHEIWPLTYRSILSEAQLGYMLELLYSHSSLKNQIENLHHSFILIKNENEFAGYASYSPHIDNSAIFHLNKIYVLPSEQGKHAGKQMLEYIISAIEKQGAIALQLNVNRFNKALHFYKKHGFSFIREEDFDIGEGYWMNDWVMEKKI